MNRRMSGTDYKTQCAHRTLLRSVSIFVVLVATVRSFSPSSSRAASREGLMSQCQRKGSSSYEETDSASKGIVSSLTGLVNSLSPHYDDLKRKNSDRGDRKSPKSAEELRDRIRDDYVVQNYLWTGKLDISCFEDNCRFTDPTITFEGSDKFLENVQNLVPLVDKFVEKDCNSDLLDIKLYPEYVETRWNMVGKIKGLFWSPKIDVIGRTKFWYRNIEDEDDDSNSKEESIRVYFYDEAWEIPAYQALLQLVTPAGTFPNTKLE